MRNRPYVIFWAVWTNKRFSFSLESLKFLLMRICGCLGTILFFKSIKNELFSSPENIRFHHHHRLETVLFQQVIGQHLHVFSLMHMLLLDTSRGVIHKPRGRGSGISQKNIKCSTKGDERSKMSKNIHVVYGWSLVGNSDWSEILFNRKCQVAVSCWAVLGEKGTHFHFQNL